MLNMCFLGKTKFEYKGKITTETLGNKAAALICLLVLNQNKYLSREKIIGYLWPDSSEEAAKYNLRFNLWQIKKYMEADSNGEQLLHIDKDCCGINNKYEFTCDILDVLNFKPSEGDNLDSLLKLRELFCGDFLEGSYFSNCDEFNEFILFERINIEKRKVRILKEIACLYESNGNYDGAIEIINEIHEIEPYDEEMALKIMKLNIAKGNRAGAIEYYRNFSNRLSGGLGISPNEPLQDLYSEIRSHENENHVFLPKVVEEELENSVITINTFCMKGIEYFWMSEVIGQLLKKIKLCSLNKLEQKYILDLSYIQTEILHCLEETAETEQQDKTNMEVVPTVRIISAFVKFLEIISQRYEIIICIGNYKDMDEISSKVLQHLQRIKIKGLSFQNI